MTDTTNTGQTQQTAEQIQNARVADVDAAAKAAQEAANKAAGAPQKTQAELDAEKAAELAKAKETKNDGTDPAANQSTTNTDEGEADSDDGQWKEQWVATGNEHADAAIELMKEAGIKPVEGNDIFAKAIESGDLKDIKWDILESRLGKAKASLVKAGVQAYFDGEYKEQMATKNYAHEQVGGADGWTKVQKWAAKLEKDDMKFALELADYRKAIGVGGFAARAAIDAIKAAYEADPKNGSLGGEPQLRGTGTPKSSISNPLSRAGYFQELEKAGGDRAPQNVKDELARRRQAGVALGM